MYLIIAWSLRLGDVNTNFFFVSSYRYPKNRVGDAEILRVLECARKHGALVCVHAENDAAISHMTNALVAAGNVGTKYHAVAK